MKTSSGKQKSSKDSIECTMFIKRREKLHEKIVNTRRGTARTRSA